MLRFPALSIVILCFALSYWFASFSALARSSQEDALPSTLVLDGKWQFKPIPRTLVSPELKPDYRGWQSIHVPDNWFRQGQDIHGQAWYRKEFTVGSGDTGRHVQLRFQGIDYSSDVWLNGKYLGHHEGYFQPFEFDVTPHLKVGNNKLTVLVDSPLEAPKDWSFNKRLIKGVLSHHDTRPGGAWSARGQEQNTGGIWAPVTLEFSNQTALRMLLITPTKQAAGWKVQIEATTISDVSHETKVQLNAEIVPENFQGDVFRFNHEAILTPGTSKLSMAYDIAEPALWWPAEYGEPNLYRLKLNMSVDGRLLDRQEQVFGFRSVHVDDGRQWYINGKRMFVRGTNYIGSQWLAELTDQKVNQDLALMREANINAVRIHAHVTSSAFYDSCDRLGMLVMQDFPLLWGYTDSTEFITNARQQVKEMVLTLANHPSIVSWTMHNEPPWDAPWMTQKYPDYDPERNLKLDNLLYDDIRVMDTTRVTRRESATKEHEWMGWYFGTWHDFSRPASTPWVTEFGAQALPVLPSLQRIFSPKELWPDTEEKWRKWEFHNFQRHETFDLAHLSMGSNIQEFIANTQHYQARLIQFATENYRRQRYAPITAIFQFMFVENWPSINWGIMDYWRQPKAGYKALRQAYQPILPSLEWRKDEFDIHEPISIGLWAINDTWQGYEQAKYKVSLWQHGKELHRLDLPLEMLPDSGYKLRDYGLPDLPSGEYTLKAHIEDSQGRFLGENQFKFRVLAK